MEIQAEDIDLIMRIETHSCKKYNHREFAIDIESDALSAHAAVLMRSIEDMVARGEVLKPGETFQFGWLILKIQPLDDTWLTLTEPDQKSEPIQYVPNANGAILHTMHQLFTLDSFGIERARMMMPNMREKAIVCDRFQDTAMFFMTRNEPFQPGDSGWYMGCLDPDHDHNTHTNLSCISLYEAFLKRNAIHNWIVFPTESKIVLIPGSAPKVWIGQEAFKILPGSFVEKMIHDSK